MQAPYRRRRSWLVPVVTEQLAAAPGTSRRRRLEGGPCSARRDASAAACRRRRVPGPAPRRALGEVDRRPAHLRGRGARPLPCRAGAAPDQARRREALTSGKGGVRESKQRSGGAEGQRRRDSSKVRRFRGSEVQRFTQGKTTPHRPSYSRNSHPWSLNFRTCERSNILLLLRSPARPPLCRC